MDSLTGSWNDGFLTRSLGSVISSELSVSAVLMEEMLRIQQNENLWPQHWNRELSEPPSPSTSSDSIFFETYPPAEAPDSPTDKEASGTVNPLKRKSSEAGDVSSEEEIAPRKRAKPTKNLDEAREELLGIGYSEEFVNKFLKKCGKARYAAFVENQEHIEKLILNEEDLLHIGHGSGLEAFFTHIHTLRRLGYAVEDVVRISGYQGSRATLEALPKLHDSFVGLGYDIKEITRIAAHSASADAMEAFLSLWSDLKGMGFNKIQMLHLLARNSAAKCLIPLHSHAKTLLNNRYSHASIVFLAVAPGRDTNLARAVNECGE